LAQILEGGQRQRIHRFARRAPAVERGEALNERRLARLRRPQYRDAPHMPPPLSLRRMVRLSLRPAARAVGAAFAPMIARRGGMRQSRIGTAGSGGVGCLAARPVWPTCAAFREHRPRAGVRTMMAISME